MNCTAILKTFNTINQKFKKFANTILISADRILVNEFAFGEVFGKIHNVKANVDFLETISKKYKKSIIVIDCKALFLFQKTRKKEIKANLEIELNENEILFKTTDCTFPLRVITSKILTKSSKTPEVLTTLKDSKFTEVSRDIIDAINNNKTYHTKIYIERKGKSCDIISNKKAHSSKIYYDYKYILLNSNAVKNDSSIITLYSKFMYKMNKTTKVYFMKLLTKGHFCIQYEESGFTCWQLFLIIDEI